MQEVWPGTSLATLPPGPKLAAALAGIELSEAANVDLVGILQSWQRQLSHAQAQLLATMVEVAHATPLDDIDDPDHGLVRRSETAHEWASAEIRAALTLTQRAADDELDLAETLLTRMPQVFTAMYSGQIDRRKARVFAEHLRELTDPQIDVICAALVPAAARLTTGQLAARLLRMVIAIDPEHARRRYERGISERAVIGYLAADGTATISAHGLPAPDAIAACARLDQLAAAVRDAGHPGRLDHIRAELFLGMLSCRFQNRTTEQIIADLLAAIAADTTPGGGTDPGPTQPAAQPHASQHAADPAPSPPAADPGPTQPAAQPRASRLAADRGAEAPASAGENPPPEPPEPAEPAAGRADEPASVVALPSRATTAFGLVSSEIRVGLATLLGLDEHAAQVPGWGELLPDTARAAIARRRGARWRYAVTDADGYLLHAGVTRRRPRGACSAGPEDGGTVELRIAEDLLIRLARDNPPSGPWAGVIADITAQYSQRERLFAQLDAHPSDRFARAALRRHVEIRDRTCCHPGCRRGARTADLDHTRDHALGGATITTNLGPVCERHHLLKHRGGWRLEQPRAGHFIWTSPLGQVYRTRGEPIAPPVPDPRPRYPDLELEPGLLITDPFDGPTFCQPLQPRPPPSTPARQSPITPAADPPPF